MVCLAPRTLEDSVRPRRLAGVGARPLNFTVRGHMATHWGRSMNRVTALLVSATFLCACVSTRTAEVATVGQERTVQLRQVTTGLLIGPCGPVPGRDVETHWIQLKGNGPVYPMSEVSFVDANGNVFQPGKGVDGEVRIDTAHHKIIVDIRNDAGPTPDSGTYRYKGEL